jgi:putative hydrolase of the HAD superfamily
VLTTSPFAPMAQMGEDHGMGGAAMLELLLGPYDQDTDHPWHQLERGEIALAAAAEQIKIVAAEAGLDIELADMFGSMGGSTTRTDMVDKAVELKKAGYRTALITNNIKEFSDGWRAMIPVDDMFEVIVDSSAVGMRKPDPRIYQLALDQLGVAAERSVFLDDAKGNIAAAEALGMKGILVEDDHLPALAELDRLLAEG